MEPPDHTPDPKPAPHDAAAHAAAHAGAAPAERSLRASPTAARVLDAVAAAPRRWLVTGGAGFIGSHLVETLLRLGQRVVVLDDLSTGYQRNLDLALAGCDAGSGAGERLTVVRGDVRDADGVRRAAEGADVVLHHAALVSVPLSVDDPRTAHDVNTTGFLNVLEAARATGARVVFAASSASYGDDPADVKTEDRLGAPLSMYAASKTANETYAAAYAKAYGLGVVGLRYFNVFGARQDPRGAYAAVIPNWVAAMAAGRGCVVHGDGLTTRDFCHVANVVFANLAAATTEDRDAFGEAFNIGTGTPTTLLELHVRIADAFVRATGAQRPDPPSFGPFRAGDVRHSCADVGKAARRLGFEPVVGLDQGLDATVRWFVAQPA
jgi:UDP-N-acetylglucosamine/UDP-N-acetylgalactosamine 4-epimerase